MSTTETTVQLLNRRDAITSRIATYRQPGRPARQEDLDELGEVMAEIHRRETEQSWEMTPEAAERNAKFAAFATAAADIDPALYGLPQDSEIGPEFYPEPDPDLCPYCGTEHNPMTVCPRERLTRPGPPAGWDVAEPGPEQARPTVERWDNPVPVKCSARSSARAGQEMLPGGGEFSCHETASFLEMRNGEGVRFLCDRHGKERRQELREARP